METIYQKRKKARKKEKKQKKESPTVSLFSSWFQSFRLGFMYALLIFTLFALVSFFGYLPWQASRSKVVLRQISPASLLEIKHFMCYHGVHVVCLGSNSISFIQNGYLVKRKVSLSTFSPPEVLNANQLYISTIEHQR